MRLVTWLIYRLLGKHWGRIVSGSISSLLGLMLLIVSATTGQGVLVSGFWLLVVAFGVLLLVLGFKGLKAQKASGQVSYGYGTPQAPAQPGYPPQAGASYGQPGYPYQAGTSYGQQGYPQYGTPYGQAAAPQYPLATPYGQPVYPPAGQAQYPGYPAPAAPYGQGAAPQYPPATPYGQPVYPPQQPYGQPSAGQYPYQ
jgi:hypothetical protein